MKKIIKMEKVINSILERAEKEREENKKYKDLFENSDDLESLVENLKKEIMNSVLNTCNIINKKFNYNNIQNEAFNLLLGIALYSRILNNKIVEEEGISCSVDKTHFILTNILRELLKEEK